MHGRDEHVHDRGAVPGASLPAVRDAPPEERGGAEEAQMLNDVDAFVLDGVVVEDRHVPDPERERRRGRTRIPASSARSTRVRRRLRRTEVTAARRTPSRHRPEQADDGRAVRDQRRRDDHEQLVLHHVGGEPFVAPLVERRR